MKQDTTSILRRLSEGDHEAFDELIPRVYEELRLVASQHLGGKNDQGSLECTVLVHEAYLRLIDQRVVDWQDRTHFLAIASTVMRRVMLDHFRAQNTVKRGGNEQTVQLRSSVHVGESNSSIDLIQFDEVLGKLESLHPRHAKVVEMRFFSGLTIQETAHALGVSIATVKNDWRAARAWLAVEMDG